jgi:hypothetical protein
MDAPEQTNDQLVERLKADGGALALEQMQRAVDWRLGQAGLTRGQLDEDAKRRLRSAAVFDTQLAMWEQVLAGVAAAGSCGAFVGQTFDNLLAMHTLASQQQQIADEKWLELVGKIERGELQLVAANLDISESAP